MRLQWVVGAVGALATALGALAVLGAGLAPVAGVFDPLVTALSGLGTRRLALAAVAVAILGLAVSLLLPGGQRVLVEDGAAERFERRLDRPPEGVTGATPLTGETLDEDVARAVAGDERALSAVRERLRDLAETTVADRVDEPAEAGDRVASGAWTDDRTAAAFLADGAPTASLRSRLRLWLDPAAEHERRIHRTAGVIERLADGESSASVGETPPERDADATCEERRADSTCAGQESRDSDAGGSNTGAGESRASGGGR